MFKKIIIFSLLLLDVFLVTNSILAAPNTPTIAPTPAPLGVDPAGQKGPNPAPPIGLTPCGKTMCNEDEICVKYPQDKDEHCVPKEKYPLPQPTPPKELPSNLKRCPDGTGVFPPNSTCVNNITNTFKDLSYYQKTCIYEPVIQYEGTRGPTGPIFPEQPFTSCGKGYAGPGRAPEPPPGGPDKYKCAVNMLVYTDVRDAELGGYGSTPEVRQNESTDFVAQNYLYNALFDKPLDLSSNSKDNPNNNREAYRTYWRLLSASTQANLRSFIMNMAKEKQINDIEFSYINTLGQEVSTSTNNLYDKLKKQVIFFWHWPFVRIGCLTDYPVCPEFAQAIKDLEPLTQNLTKTIAESPTLNVAMSSIVQTYKPASIALGLDVRDAYNTFVPLNFDSARTYIVRKKIQEEQDMYDADWNVPKLRDDLNKGRYDTNKPSLTTVSRENTPYINAIYQGLLSPKFGIMSSLQPQWLTEKYATPEGSIISDYKIGNSSTDFPEVKIAKQNLVSFLQEQNSFTPAGIITNTSIWVYNQIKSFFQSEDNIKIKGYTENNTDIPLHSDLTSEYVNFKGCPLPVSYHIISPKTAAALSKTVDEPKYSDHHQIISIWGPELAWSYTPDRQNRKEYICNKGGGQNGRGATICYWNIKPCPDNEYSYPESEDICQIRKWTVSGTKHGMALTVLNNPKNTDIKNTIVQNNNFSLYKTLVPDSFNKKKITDASIDAPYAANYLSHYSGGTATSPNGESKILNEVEPINRINNRAQDTMHLLQNCWTVPEKLQNSPRCKLPLAASSKNEICDGKLFKQMFPSVEPVSAEGEAVYNQVKSQVTEGDLQAYAEAEKQTGVPCEVLAAIHYREADNSESLDLQSGGDLGGRSLTESAIQAANELLAKAGGKIDSVENLMKALSWYNGGGNANCQAMNSVDCPYTTNGTCGSIPACNLLPANASPNAIAAACTCSGGKTTPGSCRDKCGSGTFPFKIPAPPSAMCNGQIGFDDPYVTELWQLIHKTMYVLYKYDCTATTPDHQNRLGTLPYAILFNKELTSQ